MEIPMLDLPYYMWDFFKQLLGQQLYPSELKKWGPMSPEIIEYSNKSIEEACAYQWKQTVERSLNDLDKFSSDRVVTIKYENFLEYPEKSLREIFNLCDLKYSERVINYACKIIKPNNFNKWEENENKQIVEKVSHIITPTLEDLEYI